MRLKCLTFESIVVCNVFNNNNNNSSSSGSGSSSNSNSCSLYKLSFIVAILNYLNFEQKKSYYCLNDVKY